MPSLPPTRGEKFRFGQSRYVGQSIEPMGRRGRVTWLCCYLSAVLSRAAGEGVMQPAECRRACALLRRVCMCNVFNKRWPAGAHYQYSLCAMLVCVCVYACGIQPYAPLSLLLSPSRILRNERIYTVFRITYYTPLPVFSTSPGRSAVRY